MSSTFLITDYREARQDFFFIPKGNGVLSMPVSEFKDVAGIAAGAHTNNYRDRKDHV